MSTLPQWRRSASRFKLGCVGRELATAEEFIAAALEELPEARKDAEDFDGLPYMQVNVLAGIAQRAKGAGDWKKYQQVLDLVDRFLPRADGELHNAIHVSFLEHIDFIGPRGAKAWQLMSPRLRSAWKDIITYNEQLLGRPWPQGKVKPWLTKAHKGRRPTLALKRARKPAPRRRG